MSLSPSPACGKGIPLDTPHSVIISLPKWSDNIALCEHKLDDILEATYPRFSLDAFVKQVCFIILYPHNFTLIIFFGLAEQHDTIVDI